MSTINKPTDAEIVARHYLIASLRTDAPDGTNPRITKQASDKANEISWQFLEIIGQDAIRQVEEAYRVGDYGRHPDCGSDRPWLAAMGHDLWLTSQGHGTGFWDRQSEGIGEELGDYLTRQAQRFSGIHPEFYRGWLYLHGTEPLSLKAE